MVGTINCSFLFKSFSFSGDVIIAGKISNKSALEQHCNNAQYTYTLSEKLSKFPQYNMKCSGKHDTTWNIPRCITFSPLHFMLYCGKSISVGTVYTVRVQPVIAGHLHTNVTTSWQCLKETMSRDFRHFFIKKPPGPHMKRQKRFREILHFWEDICKNRVSA